MERLTIKDIAKMAGVSHTTVSRALNGAQNIRPETYAKIMELCRTTGYTPNAAARQLKRSDSGAIGIIVPDISNAFFCELTRHLEWMTRQKGRNVFISSSFYDYEIEDENIRALMENRVSGIILSGVGDQTYLHLRNYLGKVPIVFLGDNIPEGMVSQITVNNYEGTRMATRYLISLGHRELMFLGGRDFSVTHRRRHQGFLDAAAAMTFLPFCLAARLKMDTAQGLHISPIVLRINSLLLPASCVSAIILHWASCRRRWRPVWTSRDRSP